MITSISCRYFCRNNSSRIEGHSVATRTRIPVNSQKDRINSRVVSPSIAAEGVVRFRLHLNHLVKPALLFIRGKLGCVPTAVNQFRVIGSVKGATICLPRVNTLLKITVQ